MESLHPTPLQLEMWHAGEPVTTVSDHLRACVQCQTFIRGREEARTQLLARIPPERFVREVRERAVASFQERRWIPLWRGLGVQWGLALAGTLVMVLCLARPWFSADFARSATEPLASPEMATTPAGNDDERAAFIAKGHAAVAVILKRGTEQILARGSVALVPGDELRLRFQLEKAMLVSAGILMDGGEWIPLVEGEFGPGLHTPEATLRVDDHPSPGRLIWGSPSSVLAAREGKQSTGVQMIELRAGSGLKVESWDGANP